MTTDRRDAQASCSNDQRSEIKPIKEALEQPRDDVVITYSKEVSITPGKGEYANLLHHVEIRSFEDLQALSFIPDKLDEKRTLDALTSDDASALSAAQNYVQARGKSCRCQEAQTTEEIHRKASYASDLRTTYESIRRWQNPQLARMLTEAYRKEVAWDSPIAAHVRGWVHLWQLVHAIPIWIFLPNNITVLNNATLHVPAITKLLLANQIRIHAGGRIWAHSSYTKIKCASIQGNLP